MGPGNRKAKECDYIFCGVSVPGVVPAGAHVHVEGIGDADSFKLIHKVGKVNHVHRINDAEISVELRKGPVAAGSWSVKVHDLCFIIYEAELHKAAAACVSGFFYCSLFVVKIKSEVSII